jgi:starch phosphorylase
MKLSAYLPRALPASLKTVADLATDLRWTWSHESDFLWRTMDPEVWEQTENPYVVLQYLSEERLEELSVDPVFIDQLKRLKGKRREYLAMPGWYGERHDAQLVKGIAYLSMEFGLGEALPLYAGGLGILAGDYLKTASDMGVPVTGIGLLYQEGYFRQALDASGWQQEVYPYNDPTSLPVFPVQRDSGAWLRIHIELPGRMVRCRIWQVKVGRVTLYLLDSNDPLNDPVDRTITGKLYGGGEEMRLVQEIVLGIGGWQLVKALGLPIEVCHLNEGHAAFATLERARHFMQQADVNFWEALWATRPGNIFTTHTPVAAGFDTYPAELVVKYGQHYAERLGVSLQDLAALGRSNSDDPGEPFGMAWLAARTCGAINGVSRLHGEVSRDIFQVLYPRWPKREVPVTHVTNGVHVPSWDSPWADELWTRFCGKERWRGMLEPMLTAIGDLSDEDLLNLVARERNDLLDHARKRLARQLGGRGADPGTIASAANVLDPDILTLGFARRFTEYKRPGLLLHDPERLVRLLNNPQRPLQLIIAGKAHPRDDAGKRFVQKWAQFVQRPDVRHRAIFLEDYDMALAQEMVQGVDVWLNTPRRPMEACGTSGMKVLVNGGLNISSLDGWWAEAYSPEVGWALGDGGNQGPERDATDATELYRLLENEVVPMFYDRDSAGLPRSWINHMRDSMAHLTARFSANRMVQDYVEHLYLPAAQTLRDRENGGKELVRELRDWELLMRRQWPFIHWGRKEAREDGEGMFFEVQLYLGELPPDAIQVQLYAEPAAEEGEPVRIPMERGAAIPGVFNGFVYGCKVDGRRSPGDFTPRAIPHHPKASIPIELNLISWWPGG